MFLTLIILSLLGICAVFGIRYWAGKQRDGTSQTAAEQAGWLAGKTALILVVALIALKVGSSLYINYLWYSETGYQELWFTRKVLEVLLFLVGGVLAWTFLSVNETIARFFLPDLGEGWSAGIRWLGRVAKTIISLTSALWALSGWDEILLFLNQQPFGVSDPIHNKDVAFYVFGLPFYNLVQTWLFMMAILAVCLLVILYLTVAEEVKNRRRNAILTNVTRRGAAPQPAPEEKPLITGASAHISLLGAVVFLAIALFFWLARYEALDSGHSPVISGAGYMDVNIYMFGFTVLGILAFITAVALGIGFFSSKFRDVGILSAMVGVVAWVILMGLVPFVTYYFSVRPAEVAYEAPYIKYQIEGTRKGYNLTAVNNRGEFPYVKSLGSSELRVNNQMLSGIRVVDWRPLLDANDSLQEIRQYYDFADVDIDRYSGAQVMLSTRELNIEQLPSQARTWVNTHLAYTHGYGYTVAEVNKSNPQGPSYIVSDIPPKGPQEFMVEHPEVYFGQVTDHWVIVNTTEREFGRPSGAGSEYVRYSGSAGIALGGFFRRLLFAVYFAQAFSSGNLCSSLCTAWKRCISRICSA